LNIEQFYHWKSNKIKIKFKEIWVLSWYCWKVLNEIGLVEMFFNFYTQCVSDIDFWIIFVIKNVFKKKLNPWCKLNFTCRVKKDVWFFPFKIHSILEYVLKEHKPSSVLMKPPFNNETSRILFSMGMGNSTYFSFYLGKHFFCFYK